MMKSWMAFALLLVLFFTSACAPARTSAPPASTPAYLTPGTSTLDTPSPEPAPSAIALNPAIKAALGENTDYTVATDGNAVIALKDTNQSVEIVKAVDVKTNDGLAKDIKTGYDKDNNRFVYVENYGWVKDIDPGTPEKRTQVPYEWFGNGAVNTIAALHYQDHPTIPAGAIDPQWWLTAGGGKEQGGYVGFLTLIPLDNGKLIVFKKSTQPYGSPTLWLEFSKDGQDFVTVVQPNKNPDKDNGKPDQLINMNWTFDKDRFDQTGKNVDNLIDYLIHGKVSFQALIAADSSRSSILNRATYLYGPDGVFHSPDLQKPGELFSLFTPDEQMAIKAVWVKDATVPWGLIPNSEADINIKVLPPQLALKLPTADYTHFKWGDIQP